MAIIASLFDGGKKEGGGLRVNIDAERENSSILTWKEMTDIHDQNKTSFFIIRGEIALANRSIDIPREQSQV